MNQAIIHIFATSLIPSGMNSNFVALIPKVQDFIKVKDFRPIVMGNFPYKVYTKILASRLGRFIGGILSQYQFGFIPS